MKKFLPNIKSILLGLVITLSFFVSAHVVLATDYTYSYPYTVITTTPPPPSPISVTLVSTEPNPIQWPAQSMTTLVWNIAGSPDYCLAADGFPTWSAYPSKPATNGIHQEVSSGLTPGTYLYKITCYKAPETPVSATAFVVVTDTTNTPAPTVTLTGSPNPINSGSSAMLSWNTTDATSCQASGGPWNGSKNVPSGSESTGALTGTTTYYLTCTGPGGNATAIETVYVTNTPPPLPVVTLRATPAIIDPGQSATLSWLVQNATNCQANGGPWSGSKSIPAGSESTGPLYSVTTYVLRCTNTQGSTSAYATVFMNGASLPVISFSASPTVVNSGASSMLSWSVQDATNCYANGGPWSGSKSVPTGSQSTGPLLNQTTYTLSCDNATGSVSASATVSIVGDDDTPVISYFQPYSCVSGGSGFGTSPKFAWESTDATSCTITRITPPIANQSVGISAQSSGGSLEFDGLYYFLTNLPVVGNSSSYRLQCVNGTKTATEYAAVNVCSPDFSLSANPILRSFVNGINPGTGNPGKIATYTVYVNPISGFNAPVGLSVSSFPNTMPASTSFTFSSNTVNFSGSSYETAVLTVGIDSTDFPLPVDAVVYSPITIQGIGGGFTRTVNVSADATGKKRPIYIER